MSEPVPDLERWEPDYDPDLGAHMRESANGDWMAYVDHVAEVERLTKERDDARAYGAEARIRENNAEDRRVSASFEIARLRNAIRTFVYANDTEPGLDRPITPKQWERAWNAAVEGLRATLDETYPMKGKP